MELKVCVLCTVLSSQTHRSFMTLWPSFVLSHPPHPFDVHFDSTDSTTTTEFTEILNCFNLTQQVNFQTHDHGLILDLVRFTGLTVRQLSGFDITISDHLAITVEMETPFPFPKDNLLPASLHFSLLSLMENNTHTHKKPTLPLSPQQLTPP